MKPMIVLIAAIVACAAGYMFEPSLRPQAAKPMPADEETTADATEVETPAKPETPTISETPEPTPAVAPEEKPALPETLTLTSEVQFTDEASGLVITLTPGSKVKLLSIEGEQAVVRPGQTTYSVSVPLEATDFAAAKPAMEEPETTQPEPEPEPEPTTVPETSTTVEEPVEETPATEPATEPFTEPAAEPEPEPAIAPPPTAPVARPQGPVAVMQQSIRNGQIKEFTLDQVQEWQPGPQETIDGEVYQTGVVTYRAETIFGVKTIQAKAIIKDGVVLRWVWPKSGMEIR